MVLFVYNRPWHLEQTIAALARNEGAGRTDLIIYSDGPRDERDLQPVERCRRLARRAAGFRSLAVVEQQVNQGLSASIVRGITDIFKDHPEAIILEDDLVTSPYFLRFMNDALRQYAEEDRVVSVHGYVPARARGLPETFFLRGADCWGWATWRRGWELFEPDGSVLLRCLETRHLVQEFDLDGAYSYTRLLRRQAAGEIDSWAIRWHASAFLSDKLTLFPGRSLVRNVGLDYSGTHPSGGSRESSMFSERPCLVGGAPIAEDPSIRAEIARAIRRRPTERLANALTSRIKWLARRFRGSR